MFTKPVGYYARYGNKIIILCLVFFWGGGARRGTPVGLFVGPVFVIMFVMKTKIAFDTFYSFIKQYLMISTKFVLGNLLQGTII